MFSIIRIMCYPMHALYIYIYIYIYIYTLQSDTDMAKRQSLTVFIEYLKICSIYNFQTEIVIDLFISFSYCHNLKQNYWEFHIKIGPFGAPRACSRSIRNRHLMWFRPHLIISQLRMFKNNIQSLASLAF